ncbi:hypothetical protein NE237_008185 [Protea cynaroides]|uniref:Uncharacterized protein n=1 Tax=Protea cynaroides TaxID=273540 RepID=A0A9Q0KQU1_9MAGN|nr:hypothetical protein NE237_008185 [Protea cynaroides]
MAPRVEQLDSRSIPHRRAMSPRVFQTAAPSPLDPGGAEAMAAAKQAMATYRSQEWRLSNYAVSLRQGWISDPELMKLYEGHINLRRQSTGVSSGISPTEKMMHSDEATIGFIQVAEVESVVFVRECDKIVCDALYSRQVKFCRSCYSVGGHIKAVRDDCTGCRR